MAVAANKFFAKLPFKAVHREQSDWQAVHEWAGKIDDRL